MSGVLSLSTYPLRRPRHGGQRRVTAFAEFYRSLGVPFSYACVFEPANYTSDDVGADDLALDFQDRGLRDLPYVGDLISGRFAAQSDAAFDHFAALIGRLRPKIIQLDHPFMWPLLERLKTEGRFSGATIYSSHNYEGPLKEEILISAQVTPARARNVREQIEALERACVLAADLVIAVSRADAARYQAMAPETAKVKVVPNGVSRPPQLSRAATLEVERVFQGRKYCLFVGSAYPPNIDGFANLVAKGGLFFTPPEKSFAVCGGVSHGIFSSPEYGRFVIANSDRVHFFPDIDDDGLSALKQSAHAILLPIEFGGGSNLKTAEALVLGKHIVATPTALRGYENFAESKGIAYASDRRSFRAAIMRAMHAPPLILSEPELEARDVLYWDKSFIAAGISSDVSALLT